MQKRVTIAFDEANLLWNEVKLVKADQARKHSGVYSKKLYQSATISLD